MGYGHVSQKENFFKIKKNSVGEKLKTWPATKTWTAAEIWLGQFFQILAGLKFDWAIYG